MTNKPNIQRYNLETAFVLLKEYDFTAKDYDYMEVSMWNNGEGFDAKLSSHGDQFFQLTWGEFKALKKLVKELDGNNTNVAKDGKDVAKVAAKDDNALPLPEVERADQQQPAPLLEVMRNAYEDAPLFDDPLGYAAEIKALAQWLVPEEPEPTDVLEWLKWEQRQQIRQRLLDEARRAREGQGDG